MAPGRFDSTDRPTIAQFRLGSARPGHPHCGIRYRAVVLGTSVIDVVRATGGLIFDRTHQGWEVVAVLTDCADCRPLKIVGANVVHSDIAHAGQVRAEVPRALLIAADLLRDDPTVRQWVQQSIDHGLTDVAVWDCGGSAPSGARRPMKHWLSQAARVFKTEALRAAASAPAGLCAPAEVFRVGGVVSGVELRNTQRWLLPSGPWRQSQRRRHSRSV
jgi:hypothetical protein